MTWGGDREKKKGTGDMARGYGEEEGRRWNGERTGTSRREQVAWEKDKVTEMRTGDIGKELGSWRRGQVMWRRYGQGEGNRTLRKGTGKKQQG